MRLFRKNKASFILLLTMATLSFASSVVAYHYTATRNISVSLRVVGKEEPISTLVIVFVGVATAILILGIYSIHKLKRR